MLRTRLLTATAAVTLFAAGSAFAQDMTAPTQPAPAQTATPPAPTPETPAPAQSATPATPAPTPAPAQAAAGVQTPAATNTVVDVLRSNGQFTTLLSALDAAQLTDTLSSQPAISIFAPTDAAFAALPEADRARLMDPANVNDLRQLLLYHVVVADVNSSQIEGAKGGVETAATTEVQLDGTGDAIKVDNATVTTADIDASNGSVFIIDRVLNPAESLVATGDAEEAAAAPADETEDAAPADATTEEATPPVAADDSATGEAMDAPADTDAGETAPPPTTPSADNYTTETAPAAPGAVRPTDSSAAPAGSPAGPVTSTTTPTPRTAPNGATAPTTTTVTAPPVVNPTDGQTDDAEEGEDTTTAPTPRPQF